MVYDSGFYSLTTLCFNSLVSIQMPGKDSNLSVKGLNNDNMVLGAGKSEIMAHSA